MFPQVSMDTPEGVAVVDTPKAMTYYSSAFSPRWQLDKANTAFFLFGGVPEWLKGTGCKPVG
jgi:hypothetical protein